MKQRQAVTAVTVQRYRQGSKKVKQQILDEFCETTGFQNINSVASLCGGRTVDVERDDSLRRS